MNNPLRISLFLLRISVFLVMLMWTLDKFIRPEHAAAVYEKFYFLGGFAQEIFFVLGGLELLLLAAFLFGLFKRWSYGLVLLLHGISTFSSWKVYLTPFADGPNLLFFAAWPMLAACVALYLMRDEDTLFNINK